MDNIVKTKVSSLFRYPLFLVYGLAGVLFRADKRIARRLSSYFPTYTSFLGEFINQFLRYIGSTKSFAIHGIIIEPTNYCNLRCGHCSTQAITDKKGYMDYGLYEKLIDDNPQLTSIILTRNGEPLVHPNLPKMIRHAKSRNIYVAIYTNGILLSKELADKLLAAGLDEINFSMEGTGKDYEQNRHAPYNVLKNNIEYLITHSRSLGSRLKIGINITKIGDYERNIKNVEDEWKAMVDHIDIEPLMDGNDYPRKKRCRTLWRNAVVRWDGVVLPCCVDMKSTLIMGNLNESTLKEIFNSDKAAAIRRSHIKKKYPDVCKYCSDLAG